MKGRSIIRMTLFEAGTGQVLWIAGAMGLGFEFLVWYLSDTALSHQGRLVDVFTYTAIDLTVLFTAIFIGASLSSRDFSNRGIAEIAIPSGLSRTSLLLWRVTGYACSLVLLTLLLYGCRFLTLQSPDASNLTAFYITNLEMVIFSALKGILGLCLAVFLGTLTRPVLAILATIFIFAFGHFTAGISGLQGTSEGDLQVLSTSMYRVFQWTRIWNPGYLVLESFQGNWETPPLAEFLGRIIWGSSAIFCCLTGSAVALGRRDIGPAS